MMWTQLEKLRDLESRLASERQGRLNMSDKLDVANKVSMSAKIQIKLNFTEREAT